jgi:orotidine-5'-phosphate decarboxylase
MSFAQRVAEGVVAKGNGVCVGIDPRLESLPASFTSGIDSRDRAAQASAYAAFGKAIVDIVAPLVPVIKPQAAFFEQLGAAGMTALADVVQHAVGKGLIVIMDGKRNDIGSTAEAYADAYLGRGSLSAWGSDALTVSPYLGSDSLEPFVKTCAQREAGIFVLVKTSNPGSGFLQDQLLGAGPNRGTVYQQMAALVESLNHGHEAACGFGPVGAVVGATYPEQLQELRGIMSSSWILIPGYGAQGGTAKDVALGFRKDGLGALVNSSRGIIFAHSLSKYKDCATWEAAVERATKDMIAELSQHTTKPFRSW